MNPIRFNFNKFVNNVDVKALSDDNSSLPCGCTASPFVDKDHNHLLITVSYANVSVKVQSTKRIELLNKAKLQV